MDTVYIVERWFDPYTYEGIFGVFLAKGLADIAIAAQLERERDHLTRSSMRPVRKLCLMPPRPLSSTSRTALTPYLPRVHRASSAHRGRRP